VGPWRELWAGGGVGGIEVAVLKTGEPRARSRWNRARGHGRSAPFSSAREEIGLSRGQRHGRGAGGGSEARVRGNGPKGALASIGEGLIALVQDGPDVRVELCGAGDLGLALGGTAHDGHGLRDDGSRHEGCAAGKDRRGLRLGDLGPTEEEGRAGLARRVVGEHKAPRDHQVRVGAVSRCEEDVSSGQVCNHGEQDVQMVSSWRGTRPAAA